MTFSEDRPFTARVERLRQRATLLELSRRSGFARSTSWFQRLCAHADPWSVHPPDRDAIPRLATLMGTTADQVNAMVAREWYEIETASLPHDVAELALRLAKLDPEDLSLVRLCAERLLREQEPNASQSHVRSIAG